MEWKEKVHTDVELMELIQQVGFLPLLDSGIRGFSAEEMVDDDCHYVVFPDGGWDWPLWKWKGSLVTEGSIEDAILMTLREQGSLITRQLRAACGFTGPKMRSRFDAYVTRLQMGCYIVTEDFVYPRDKHNREYGWGWSLLTTPEQLFGREACLTDRTPEESLQRMLNHLRQLLPSATDAQIMKMIR